MKFEGKKQEKEKGMSSGDLFVEAYVDKHAVRTACGVVEWTEVQLAPEIAV